MKNGFNKQKLHNNILAILTRSLLLVALLPAAAMATENGTEEGVEVESEVDTAMQTLDQLPEEIQASSLAYQECVNTFMSTLEMAAVKRQQIIDNCQTQKEAFVNSFPEVMRQLVASQADGRLENVLTALEESEGSVIESSVDANETIQELEALEEAAE